MDHRNDVRSLTPVTLLLVGAAVLGLAWLARSEILLAFFALVLAVLLSIPVGFLSRYVPRPVALVAVVALLGGAVAGLGAIAAPTLSAQSVELQREAPKAIAKLKRFAERFEDSTGTGSSDSGGNPLPDVTGQALPAIAAVGEGLTSTVLVAVMALFLAASPETYRLATRRMVPREYEPTFDEAWRRLSEALHGWVRGTFVSMLLMGLMTLVGLWAVGVHAAILLAILTFLGTFVPYLGAVASAVPGLLVALSQDSTHFLSALAVYTAVHLTEGYLVSPLITKRAVKVQPALLLLGQGVAAATLGLMGTIVAAPLQVCVRELMVYLWVERSLDKAPESQPAG